jgi:hypothetical protein
MTLAGLPHSEISGSKRACRSPKRIVACHVLHRLSVPRHPPSTLSNLTIKCLDLMRSAVEPKIADSSCISIYNPYSIVKELRSRRPTLNPNQSHPIRAHRSSRGLLFLVRCGNQSNLWEGDVISAQPFTPAARVRRRVPPQPVVVELIGIEPTTPCLQSRCSPN